MLGKVQNHRVEGVFRALNALGDTISLRLLPRLKLNNGVERYPKICMTWGSRYASSRSESALLIEGNIALIPGL